MMGDIDNVGFTAIICLFGLPFVCGLTAILSRAWIKIACHQKDIDLKHHMLASGMSAKEIERVLNAGNGEENHFVAQTETGQESCDLNFQAVAVSSLLICSS
ncbi:MAG: hypothetical protein K0U86_17920 [Planctomycetes bacterium]|nr:hypothetical protein [Planctomycetota bacterium]MCH9726785.1 hypothetical protein [Planctomycetota bacterium]MCH9776810.1 hypothetical protein [Planctomycetota bacterium]MCH9790069.1 hypothetical protein [Planctomycetota bacterium]